MDKNQNIKKVYSAFIKAGFSPNQAKALTAEVGRENAYQSKYIFGHHTDMANSADNLGFFSWQGERKKNLLNKLQQKGLYVDGKIKEGQEALDTMAEFAKEEMQNIGSYKKTKEGFLNNPNISQQEAAELLGRNYLRWDMDGKYIKNVAEHKKRRDKYYSQISGEPYVETDNSVATAQTQQETPYIPLDLNLPEMTGMAFAEEEKETEEKPQVNKREENANKLSFISDVKELQKQQQEQAYQPPQFLEQQLVEGVAYQPIQQNFQQGGYYFQQGGTWSKQQQALKAEKDAKLKKLLEQERPTYKKKTLDEKIAEKRQEQTTRVVSKDNTATKNYNDATKHSNVARNKTDKEIAEERKVIREKSDNNVLNSWSLDAFKPSNYTRENIAEMAQGLESKFRVSDEPNFFDDYLNPANMIGGMASNLGQAPLQAQQTDSYMPYVTAVGAPLTVGAMAGIGTQNTGQFVNNLVNPLAGVNGRGTINYLGDSSMGLPSSFLDKLKNKKASMDVSDWIRDDLSDPETIRRAVELGIDPEILEQATKNLTINSNPTKSYYSSPDLEINISPKQIGRTADQEIVAEVFGKKSPNFTAKEIGAHEAGHFIQDRNFYTNFNPNLKGVQPSKMDEMLEELVLNDNKDYFTEKAKKHFKKPTEKYPFFREYRQGMRESGVLKNKWDEITPEMVDEFARLKPENRLNTLMELSDENKSILREVSKIAPVTLPFILDTDKEDFQKGGTKLPNGVREVTQKEFKKLNEKSPLVKIGKDNFYSNDAGDRVIIKKEDSVLQPKVEALKIQPIENTPILPIMQLDFVKKAEIPKSFDITSKRYNMKGENEFYNYDKEGVNSDEALKLKIIADKYNKYIEDKYGNEEALKNPKAVERLKQLRQEVTIKPNYQQGGEKKDIEWLNNWYQNRVIPNQDIQNLYEEDKDFYTKRLQNPPTTKKVESIDNTPEITGRYDGKNILITPNASDNVYLHELTHYSDDFPSAMRTVHGEIVRQNVAPKEYTQGIYNQKYDYFTDPDEVHARIQVLRKKAGIKPDQDVTPEFLDNFLKEYKGEDENINDLLNIADPPHLLEMINFMASNDKSKKDRIWVAKNGGIKVDPQGYWNPENLNKPVVIPSPSISMKNVDFAVLGTSLETGEQKLMQPNKNYFFKNTQNVLEQPAKNINK